MAKAQDTNPVSVVRQIDSLIEVSRSLTAERDFKKALEVNTLAENLALETLGQESMAYGSCCFNRGRVNNFSNNFLEAEKWYLESIAIWEKTIGKEHPDYAASLNNLGSLYVNMGEYEKAEPRLLEAVAIRGKVMGKQHLDYAYSLQNVGMLYTRTGAYEKAETIYAEAIAILASVLGTEHPNYASFLNNFGVLYQTMQEYEKAEPLYREAFSISEKTLGKESPIYALRLLNLAGLYNYERAEPLYLEAMAIFEKTLGKEHPYYAQSLDVLADLYRRTEKYDKAALVGLEAQALQEKVHGKEHPEYAHSLSNLGLAYKGMGEFKKAERLLLEAKNIREKKLGKEHLHYAFSLLNLALLYIEMDRPDKAEPLTAEAIAVQRDVLGKEHLDYAWSLTYHGRVYEAKGEYGKAEPWYREADKVWKQILVKSSRYLSEQELARITKQFANSGELFFSLALKNTAPGIELLRSCYDNALFYKGFLLTAVSQIRNLAQSDPVTTEQFNLLKSYHRRLAQEYAKPIAERKGVAQLEEQANDLEKELARSVAGLGDAFRQVDWQEVQAGLRQGEAAVEFVSFQYYDQKLTDRMMYAAMVLRPGDKAPAFVPLFEEKELLPLLGASLLKVNALYGEAQGQKSLYELVWQPLEPHLRGVRTVYCSPAGLLHRINLGAAALNQREAVADRYRLIRLGSTRQLAVPGPSRTLGRQAYVVGGVRYERNDAAIALANTALSRSANSGQPYQMDEPPRGRYLDYLPGSKDEAAEIQKMLMAAGTPVQLDTGYYATEERFQNIGLSGLSPRILHLATHGFFFLNPKSKPGDVSRGKEGGVEVFKMSEHPMLRSGLLFAGAQEAWSGGRPPEGQEDGICTAYDISQLDLSNTELVVLSACQSGLGDIQDTEGVYGLQRAFKIAGAKYLIMSLWEVNDQATQGFMIAFYRQWLQNGLPIPDAFHAAEAQMKAQHPDSPYLWAGFVLVE